MALYAAGGGGGGSVTRCERDTWLCTDWSECSDIGLQTRSCSLSFDCQYTDDPKDAETRNCTPPCKEDIWECGDWGECVNGKKERTCSLITDCLTAVTPQPENQSECVTHSVQLKTPTPLEKETAKPPTKKTTVQKSCSKDIWECGPWLGTCDNSGNDKRLCKMTFNCPNINTPAPQFFRPCKKLQCGDKADMKERVLCRLNLAPSALEQEYALQYLPEECRLIKDEKAKTLCIARYKSFKPCWSQDAGEKRNACARQALGIGHDTSKQFKDCSKQTDPETCRKQVRQKIYEMIKFRFYDLEERAEEFIEDGVDKNIIADFTVFIVEKKNEFNRAKNNKERKRITLEVRNEWKKLIEKVKEQIL